MTTERVDIANRRGQRLAGLWCGPASESVVISCHGMLSTKDGDKHRLLTSELLQRGVTTLRFDFAGRGDSEGSLADLSFSRQIEDLDAVVEHVWKRGVRKIGVFGSSMGGAVALLTAGRDERIGTVATLAAVGHPNDIEERYPRAVSELLRNGIGSAGRGDPSELARAFFDDASGYSVVGSTRILRIPIFVVHGEEDEVIPVADAHDIASAARNASLELVPFADHRFSNPQHLRDAMRKIADFLAATLA